MTKIEDGGQLRTEVQTELRTVQPGLSTEENRYEEQEARSKKTIS